jgi:hypothetical protein
VPCYSPLKGWKDPETGGIVFRRPSGVAEEMEVACSQCLGCRLDRSRTWAMRIVHEGSLHELDHGNCFVTLTYRDPIECTPEQLEEKLHVPDDWSLHKSHFQKFMKRLRKHVFRPGGRKPEYEEEPNGTRRLINGVRFFHCGEYGNTCKHGLDLEEVGCPLCNVGRPHYHACLFNVSFSDLEAYGSAHDGSLRYTSPLLESIWKYGFVDVGELNFESAAYVSRYILKKITGVKADEHYMQTDLDGVATWVEPEYVTMSRRPGIGRDWYEKYKDDLFPSDEVPVPGSGVFKKVPRYYEEIFKSEDPLSLEEIKAIRQEFRQAHGDEYTPERLMDKYKVKKAQTELLRRNKV